MSNLTPRESEFLKTQIPRSTIVVTSLLCVLYFFIICFVFQKSSSWLFYLLIAGEVFHVWQLLTYLYTIWDTEYMPRFDSWFNAPVDVFITVCGEPVDIVEKTARAVLAMNYSHVNVYLLNDGYAAKKKNWKDIELLATRLGIRSITRKKGGGAKAGNINNALRLTDSPFVAIFDADHVPHPDFLEKMMGYFTDPEMGFVQSPQFYKNYDLNQVTRGAWEQQALFFGPICKGKNRLNAATMCGTNMILRRQALEEVGGMCEESIAEDFVTGVFMHERGWKSCYVPEVLAEGLAPEDFLSYYKQQFRWARGAMDVIFKYNIFFRRGLTMAQRIQYLSSVSFFLSGWIVLMNACIPLVFFFTGMVTFKSSTMLLASIFLPYIFFTFFVLQRSSNFTFTFKSLAFSMAGFTIHIKAFFAALTGEKSSFSVTSKRKIEGNFINLIVPHLVYIVLVVIGFMRVLIREGFDPSVVTNLAWAIVNVVIFSEFIKAALPAEQKKSAHSSIEEMRTLPSGFTAVNK